MSNAKNLRPNPARPLASSLPLSWEQETRMAHRDRLGRPIAFDVYVRPGETTTFRGDRYFRRY